ESAGDQPRAAHHSAPAPLRERTDRASSTVPRTGWRRAPRAASDCAEPDCGGADSTGAGCTGASCAVGTGMNPSVVGVAVPAAADASAVPQVAGAAGDGDGWVGD